MQCGAGGPLPVSVAFDANNLISQRQLQAKHAPVYTSDLDGIGLFAVRRGAFHHHRGVAPPRTRLSGLRIAVPADCRVHVLTAAFYATRSTEAATVLAHFKIAVLCLAYPTAVWFLAEFTQLRNPRYWMIGAYATFGILLIADIIPFGGLWYSVIRPRQAAHSAMG